MDQMKAIYTIRPFNPGSLLIRCANPVSFVKIAPASHVIAVDGEYGIEASFEHGVRRALLREMLQKLTVVEEKTYDVPDSEAGLVWMRQTADRHAKYDLKGALALGLAPDRDWQEDDDWFCFEFFANGMRKAGRDTFNNNAHVTAYMLMSIKTQYCPRLDGATI